MKIEIWKDIPNYEGLYQASNFGRIKSLIRLVNGKKNFLQLKRGKILKQKTNRHIYLSVVLCKNKIKNILYSHRIIAKTFIPNIENKPQVNHKNGRKSDNRIENLEWATAKENVIHARKIGLSHSKLTNEMVLLIRKLYSEGNISHQKLSEKFNIDRKHIGNIINRIYWKHI